jgi:segregation and condensation protein A
MDILRRLKQGGVTLFRQLFQGSRSRSELVATFLAVLELCRSHVLQLTGSETECMYYS